MIDAGRIAAAALCALFSVAMMGARAASLPAAPLPADDLDPALLAPCEAAAKPIDAGPQTIAAAFDDLIALGIVTPEDAAGARFGFCGLRRAGGPLATTSCADDTILFDAGTAAPGRGLILRTLLAHELTHIRQHRAARALHGAAYCASARYPADAAGFEREADAVGDAVRDLLVLGRPVEISNQCAGPAQIYMEVEDPADAGDARVERFVLAPGSRTIAARRALSGWVKFYARTRGDDKGPDRVWEGRSRAHQRFVDGAGYRLKRIRLTAPASATGPDITPFTLTLTCAPA